MLVLDLAAVCARLAGVHEMDSVALAVRASVRCSGDEHHTVIPEVSHVVPAYSRGA